MHRCAWRLHEISYLSPAHKFHSALHDACVPCPPHNTSFKFYTPHTPAGYSLPHSHTPYIPHIPHANVQHTYKLHTHALYTMYGHAHTHTHTHLCSRVSQWGCSGKAASAQSAVSVPWSHPGQSHSRTTNGRSKKLIKWPCGKLGLKLCTVQAMAFQFVRYVPSTTYNSNAPTCKWLKDISAIEHNHKRKKELFPNSSISFFKNMVETSSP